MTKIVAQSTLIIATFIATVVIRYLNICYFRQECPVELIHGKLILQLVNLYIMPISMKSLKKILGNFCYY